MRWKFNIILVVICLGAILILLSTGEVKHRFISGFASLDPSVSSNVCSEPEPTWSSIFKMPYSDTDSFSLATSNCIDNVIYNYTNNSIGNAGSYELTVMRYSYGSDINFSISAFYINYEFLRKNVSVSFKGNIPNTNASEDTTIVSYIDLDNFFTSVNPITYS